MYYITIYHIDDDANITKYDGGIDSYDKNSKSDVDPAWALSTFWKYKHYMLGDGWDWLMTPKEFNAKFHARIAKIMKILKLNARIRKIMKIALD